MALLGTSVYLVLSLYPSACYIVEFRRKSHCITHALIFILKRGLGRDQVVLDDVCVPVVKMRYPLELMNL